MLFRQQRVVKAGLRFSMAKFRSMVVDSEHRRTELEAANDGAGLLFKLRVDPRVIRVVAALRQYSLNELPQLLNVVAGDMSAVGPRPPFPAEVELYGMDARRKLLVKPGLTGPWQVSGRSNLSWKETVRLDLRCVENWSFAKRGSTFIDLDLTPPCERFLATHELDDSVCSDGRNLSLPSPDHYRSPACGVRGSPASREGTVADGGAPCERGGL